MSSRYPAVYRQWKDDPHAFWAEAARGIDWFEPYDRVFDDARTPLVRWFTGGRVNTCHNALDRHVAAGDGDRGALIHDSPVTGRGRRYS